MSSEQRGPLADRRKKQSSPFSLPGLRGRRRQFRRESDRSNPQLTLDWHGPRLLVLSLARMVLCLADAHNTLQLLRLGAQEAKLLMDFLIRRDIHSFVQIKLGLTALCLVVLVANQHVSLFVRIKIRHGLYTIFACYVALVGYEILIWPGAGIPLIFLPVLPDADAGEAHTSA